MFGSTHTIHTHCLWASAAGAPAGESLRAPADVPARMPAHTCPCTRTRNSSSPLCLHTLALAHALLHKRHGQHHTHALSHPCTAGDDDFSLQVCVNSCIFVHLCPCLLGHSCAHGNQSQHAKRLSTRHCQPFLRAALGLRTPMAAS